MSTLLAFIFLTLLLLLVTLVLSLLFSLGVASIGWIVGQVFPLSLFEGVILALVVCLGIGGSLVWFFVKTAPLAEGGDEGDEYDDEWEPPIILPPRRRAADAPPIPRPAKRKRDR
jgi:hypothetical protein